MSLGVMRQRCFRPATHRLISERHAWRRALIGLKRREVKVCPVHVKQGLREIR